MKPLAWLVGFVVTGALASCQADTSAVVATFGPAGVCATCHMPEYQSAHPVHVGVKPTTCGICHTSDSWHPSVVNHPWPLTGAHAKANCNECHVGAEPTFRGNKQACVDCHRSDYDGSRFPGHSRFPLTCAECHTTTAWKPTLPEPATSASTERVEPTPPANPTPSAAPSATSQKKRAPVTRPTAPTAPRTKAPSPDNVSGASRRR